MGDIPHLLDAYPIQSLSESRRFWRYIHRWRTYLFHLWCQHNYDGLQLSDLGHLVDHLLGTSLLIEYVKRREQIDTVSLQKIWTKVSPATTRDLFLEIQNSFTCPILQSVFDPTWIPANIHIPPSLFDLGWEKRITDALWLLIHDNPIALTLFGDFHQLCIANPLGLNSSTRYERGIHYTPAPVVDYLVNTVLDRAFRERSVDDIKQLRILDPSCGCGAFLIAALRYVLCWREKHSDTSVMSSIFRVQERLDVLGEMFLGIDIDEQAVARTIRLLLLAVWEATITDFAQLDDSQSIIIPDLRKNIICRSFLDIFRDSPHGCVNVILGGPPFVRLSELYRSQRQHLSSYRKQFRSARHGQFDLYMLFIEQSLNILADQGSLGFSVSNSFIRRFYGTHPVGPVLRSCGCGDHLSPGHQD